MITLVGALLLLAPPPPASHARYGPLTQCLSGYAVSASESEAIVAMEGGFTLWSDAGSFNISIDDGDPYRSQQQQRTDLDLADFGHIIRYQRTYSSGPEIHTSYLIPPRDSRPAMLVNSGDFDGSERDRRILGRIVPIDGEQGCGSFRAPAYPGETPDARVWRPSSRPGPFYRCQNGIGFPVRADEAMQTAWYDINDRPSVRLSFPDPQVRSRNPIHLVVHGPKDPVSGTGTVTAAYSPTIETMSDGPTVLLMPPRTASERHGPDERYRRWIEIAYPPGQEAAARAFADRIEFVDGADPRCQADRSAP